MGYDEQEIADHLGVQQPAVHKMLKKYGERLLAKHTESLDEHRARHIEELYRLYNAALEEFQASRSPVPQTTIIETDGPNGFTTQTKTSFSHRPSGNPQLLKEANALLQSIRQILGLNFGDSIKARQQQAARAPVLGYIVVSPGGEQTLEQLGTLNGDPALNGEIIDVELEDEDE